MQSGRILYQNFPFFFLSLSNLSPFLQWPPVRLTRFHIYSRIQHKSLQPATIYVCFILINRGRLPRFMNLELSSSQIVATSCDLWVAWIVAHKSCEVGTIYGCLIDRVILTWFSNKPLKEDIFKINWKWDSFEIKVVFNFIYVKNPKFE